MIKVNCTVNSAKDDSKRTIVVNSVDNAYNVVEIAIGDNRIHVFSDDLIQAIENCSANGHRRWRRNEVRYTPVNDEE